MGKGSWEGSAAFFLVASAVMLPFVGPATALLAAVAVAAVEVLPLGVDDNLTVPVAAATILWLLEAAGPAVVGM